MRRDQSVSSAGALSRRVAAVAAVGLLVAGCATGAPRNSAGQVTAQASVDAFQVKVGDCTGSMKEGNVADLQVIPCAQAHYFEAFAGTQLADGDYPGTDETTKRATAFCTAEFKTFIGLSTKDSAYDMYFLFPVEASWATGDREVVCLVGSDKGRITGSLRGIGK